MNSFQDNMSEAEADQLASRRILRRCSSAICLSEKKAPILEHPDLQRVKQLSGLCTNRSCLKSSSDRRQIGSTSSLNRVRLKVSDSDMNDDVFADDDSLKSAEEMFSSSFKGKKSQTNIFDSSCIIISGLYGILLVVVGSVMPMAETFVHPGRPYAFEFFYVYLYAVSISFIVYIYVFLLHDSPIAVEKIKNKLRTRGLLKRRFLSSNTECDSVMSETCSMTSRGTRKKRITFDEAKAQSAASFYLRLGAVGFGIGCMILEGLYLGQFVELSQTNDPCGDPLMMLRPILKPCFTFSQLFFIFRNSKMVVYKGRSIARFGFMHMAATNICVWFRTIVMETLQSFQETVETKTTDAEVSYNGLNLHENAHDIGYNPIDIQNTTDEEQHVGTLPLSEFSCRYSNMIGGMLMESSHFLYPFCIEYSVICAGVLYVMWKNIGTKQKFNISESEDRDWKQNHRMSIDCAGSSRGLFLGILMFVALVCSMIAFYVVSKYDVEVKAQAILVHSSEILLLTSALGAIILAAFRMRHLRFTWKTKDHLEETLILISMTGLYLFAMFSLIAACFYAHTIKGVLTIVVNILLILMATAQTIFLIVGLRLSASKTRQVRFKPGREFVTYLMLCNLSLWGVTTFEMQKPIHNPQQLDFYGPKAWTIFAHISVPLGIFYFFHSTVCLSHIWKHAWKFKRITRV